MISTLYQIYQQNFLQVQANKQFILIKIENVLKCMKIFKIYDTDCQEISEALQKDKQIIQMFKHTLPYQVTILEIKQKLLYAEKLIQKKTFNQLRGYACIGKCSICNNQFTKFKTSCCKRLICHSCRKELQCIVIVSQTNQCIFCQQLLYTIYDKQNQFDMSNKENIRKRVFRTLQNNIVFVLKFYEATRDQISIRQKQIKRNKNLIQQIEQENIQNELEAKKLKKSLAKLGALLNRNNL